MEEFNVIAECDICKTKLVLCKEVILITKENQQKVETWCEKCEDKMLEEHYKNEGELMCEVYEDIIKNSH